MENSKRKRNAEKAKTLSREGKFKKQKTGFTTKKTAGRSIQEESSAVATTTTTTSVESTATATAAAAKKRDKAKKSARRKATKLDMGQGASAGIKNAVVAKRVIDQNMPKVLKKMEKTPSGDKNTARENNPVCATKDHIREFLRLVVEADDFGRVPCGHIDMLWDHLLETESNINVGGTTSSLRASYYMRSPVFPNLVSPKRVSYKKQRFDESFGKTGKRNLQVLKGYRLRLPSEWLNETTFAKQHLVQLCFSGDSVRFEAWANHAAELDLYYVQASSAATTEKETTLLDSIADTDSGNDDDVGSSSSSSSRSSAAEYDDDGCCDINSSVDASDASDASDEEDAWRICIEDGIEDANEKLDTLIRLFNPQQPTPSNSHGIEPRHISRTMRQRMAHRTNSLTLPKSPSTSDDEIFLDPQDVSDNDVVIDEMEVEVNTFVANPVDGKAFRKEHEKQAQIQTDKAKVRYVKAKKLEQIHKKKLKKQHKNDMQMFARMQAQPQAQPLTVFDSVSDSDSGSGDSNSSGDGSGSDGENENNSTQEDKDVTNT